MGGDRPVFCGNFEYDASVREIERLFERYGPLDRVDMKTGEPHPLTLQTTSWLPVATQPFSAPLHALHPSDITLKHKEGDILRSTCATRAGSPLDPHLTVLPSPTATHALSQPSFPK